MSPSDLPTSGPGAPLPGAGGHGSQPGAGRQWPADATDLSKPDDSGGGGGVDPAALKAGHEADVFDVAPIFAIPLAVVVTFVVAFSVAVGGFWYIMSQDPTPATADPEAVARGNADLNERLARIDRAGMHANDRREVDQPRLEPLKRLEKGGTMTTRPELPTGNSPQIHPEEILPDRYALLQRSEWTGKDKKTARIPIGEAIKLAGGAGELNKQLFPVRPDGSKPVPWADQPSGANAGRGQVPVTPRSAEKKDEPKMETAPPPKKAEEKKADDKKEPPKADPKPPEKK